MTITATEVNEKNWAPNVRRRRAESLAHTSLSEIRKFIDPEIEREVFSALLHLFTQQGVDVVTDLDRQQLGLPPRGEEGFTRYELWAMEKARLDALLKPMRLTSNDLGLGPDLTPLRT